MSFELTDNDIYINTVVSSVAAGVSMGMSLFILVAALIIYLHKSARHHLDRVSFRLMLWSMFFEILYDISYIPPTLGLVANNAACAAGVYMTVANLGVVNYTCTCIAINLMLTVCFGVNPVKNGLERWYLGVSIVLGYGIPIVPAALGHFGWDPVLNVCWIRAADDEARMRNFVLDLYLWQILSCFVASVSVILTLVKLFRSGKATSKALFQVVSLCDKDESPSTTSSGNGIFTESEDNKCEIRECWRKARRRRTSGSVSLGHLEDMFLKISLKISLYPISLIIVNGLITVGDLYISHSGGVSSMPVYVLYCIYYFLYGGRGIVFATLGIFVDPSLGRGLKAVWYLHRQRKADHKRLQSEPEKAGEKHDFLEMLALRSPNLQYQIVGVNSEPAISRTSQPKIERLNSSASSIDLGQALSVLPLDAGIPILYPNKARRPEINFRDSKERVPTFTRSFSGVQTESLPSGLTDEVDVEVGREVDHIGHRIVRLQSVQANVWEGLGKEGVLGSGDDREVEARRARDEVSRKKSELERTFDFVNTLL